MYKSFTVFLHVAMVQEILCATSHARQGRSQDFIKGGARSLMKYYTVYEMFFTVVLFLRKPNHRSSLTRLGTLTQVLSTLSYTYYELRSSLRVFSGRRIAGIKKVSLYDKGGAQAPKAPPLATPLPVVVTLILAV